MRFSIAAAVGAAALAFCGLALATVVPVSPAPGGVVKSAHPTFTWTVPEGEAVDALQLFQGTGKKRVEIDFIDGLAGKTSATYKESLNKGAYYWDLTGTDADSNPTKSAVQKFVIPPMIQVGTMRLGTHINGSDNMPSDDFHSTARCNVGSVSPTLYIFKGSRVIATMPYWQQDCEFMKLTKLTGSWQAGPKYRGQHLFAQWRVKSGTTTGVGPKTPFKAH
jgi:hypothetical protein